MHPLVKVALAVVFVTAAILTAPIWAPIVIYGSQFVLTQAMGGKCGGSAVLHYIQRDSCMKGESPIIATVVDKPVGSPAMCPLLLSVQYANFSAFTELLSKGAQPPKCEGYPDRFFDYLDGFCWERPELAEQFLTTFDQQRITYSNVNQLLLKQASRNCVPGIRLAVARGASVHAEAPDGYNSLLYTTRDASEESIKATAALVALGAEPNRPSSKLDAPYDLAKRRLHDAGNWPRLDSALAGKSAK